MAGVRLVHMVAYVRAAAVERTVTGMGYDLVDVERSGGGLLRVTIDRLPGRTYLTGDSEFVLVEDCEAVTRQLQYVLEVEHCDYNRLEVSSPGLDRPLKREQDFERFAGQEAEITFKQPFQGRKKFTGVLAAAGVGAAVSSWYVGDQHATGNVTSFADRLGNSLSSTIASAATPPGSSGGGGGSDSGGGSSGGGSSGGGGGGGGGSGW